MNELDEMQGLTADMVREWLAKNGWTPEERLATLRAPLGLMIPRLSHPAMYNNAKRSLQAYVAAQLKRIAKADK